VVDPFDVTDYRRTDRELEEFFFFCVFVAGKNAVQTAKKTHLFYISYEANKHRFTEVNSSVHPLLFMEIAEHFKLGKYKVLRKFFRTYVNERPDLRTISVDELMEYPGIGPKTARFFVLHSRPGVSVAVLDTHILKYLREQGIDAPKSTPGVRWQYKVLEDIFLHMYDNYGFGTLAEFDLHLWKRYRNG